MIELRAGQNIPLRAGRIRVQVHGAAPRQLGALIVGVDLAVKTARDVVFPGGSEQVGVSLEGVGDQVWIRPELVREDAKAVLVVAGTDSGPVTAVVHIADDPVAQFAAMPVAGEKALICLEVYRRNADWKLRAVGQGYGGGIPELLREHGAAEWVPEELAELADEMPAAPAAPYDDLPHEVSHGLQRLWLIFEDAARSAAAFDSARGYAAARLDEELSEAVADPATRHTPAVASARETAQQRHDDLVAVARAQYESDSDQLKRELAEADDVLPPALARWSAPTWDRPASAADGIRLGELVPSQRGGPRIPYCVPFPWYRPLWLQTESAVAVTPVLAGLLARLAVAAPQHRTTVDIIDVGGAFPDLAALFGAVVAPSVVTDRREISSLLQALIAAAEFAEMVAAVGESTELGEHRIVVAGNFSESFEAEDIRRLGIVARRAELLGLSLVVVGAGRDDFPDPALVEFSRTCRRLPVGTQVAVVDPWTENAWEFQWDELPSEPELRERILRATR